MAGAGLSIPGAVPSQSSHVILDTTLGGQNTSAIDSTFSYQASDAVSDMFAGMESSPLIGEPAGGESPASESGGETAPTDPQATTPVATSASSGDESAVTETGATSGQDTVGNTVAAAPASALATAAAATNSLGVTGINQPGLNASQLTTTLKNANGPPRAALTTQGLQEYITDLLASASASFTSTENLGSVSLGGVLQLDGVQLLVTATLSGGNWSGTVAISATSATLFPGKSFSGTISSQTSAAPVTGTYTIGGNYSLTIPSTAKLEIKIGDALTVTASDVTFTYNPNGGANQVLATLSTATVTSGQFAGLPTATLSNFVVRGDGFSFGAFTLTSVTGSSPAISNFLSVTSATLTVSAFNVSFGDGVTPASMSGTVDLTVAGLQLFPAGGFVQFQADAVSAAYSFAGFDGTTATGKLTLSVTGFVFNFGDTVRLTAPGTVTVTPGQMVMATLQTATLSSPHFSSLGTLGVTDLAIRQDGFTLGTATWNSAGAVSIGDIVTATGLSVNLSNFALVYGPTPSIGGAITISATGVRLFPNIAILNLSLGTLSGRINFGDPLNLTPYLSLNIPNLDIPLGDALTIRLGMVDLAPGRLNMLTVPNATIAANLFSGLPDFNLGSFQLTQNGFNLGSFSITLATEVSIGDFLSVSSLTIAVSDFSINKTLSPVISGTITATLGNLTLFPGSSLVTSTFTNVQASYNFGSSLNPGRFTLTTESFSLTIGGQLSLSGQGITFSPGLTTIATVGSATLTFAPLNGLVMTLTDLQIQRTGFSIASATAGFTSDITLGSLLTLQTPTVTLSNINYVFGGALSGTVGFDTPGARLSLGSALETSASHLTGSYNLATGVLSVSMDTFGLNIGGFASLNATGGVSITYAPATDGSSEILVGVNGLVAFLGSGTGDNRVGVELTGGRLGLAVFRTSAGDVTYALDVRGTISLVGLPANTLTATGTLQFRKNSAGAVSRVVALSGGDVHLNFTANEQSVMGEGISITVGTFVSLTGNFGFQQFTNETGSYVAIGATGVNASIAAGGISLSLNGASFGLLIKAGATSGQTTYALVASGGTAGLTGVPGLSLSASGLSVRVRNGLDPTAVLGLPAIVTPGGNVSLDFANLGAGTSNVTDVQGNVTLNIAGFVSITGSFGFQQFTNGGTTYLAVGATGLSIVLGTSSTNLTLANASLGLVIAPGTGGNPATYALQARGSSTAADTSLNGVPNLTLNGSNLLVRVRKGLDVSGTSGVPNSVQTPNGAVTLDFSGLGAGATDVTDIQGHLTLAVTGFGSLEGDFGFQSYTDGTGAQTLAIGATGVTIVLGTATTNVTVSNATFGAIIRPGINAAPATYALQATASSVALNGVTGLEVSGSNLLVRIRNGLDVSTAAGIPSAIQTSGGPVTLNFAGLGSGSSNVADIQGTVTVSVANFVSLSGNFGFQSYQDGADRYLAIGATGLTVTLAAGSVNLTIGNASLGIIVKQGTPSTYALQARGSSNPADTSLNGVSGLSVSASNLLVRVRSGLDPTNLPSGIPNSIATAGGGSVILDFAGLGGGTSAVTDIQGHLTLSILNFVSLEGDFGFQRYTDGAATSLAIGAANVNAVLGTADVNVSLTGANLALLIKPGVGYALVANGGTASLNGVSDLTISSTGLAVKVRQGLDSAAMAGAPSAVLVPGGSVNLDFTGLGAGSVMAMSGQISINVANFVSLSGNFSFTKQTVGNVTKILVGASDVTAFVGTADQAMGVRITNASFGLVVFRTAGTTGSTYALKASAPSIELVGLPADIGLTGAANVAINTTGLGVNETIPNVGVPVVFTDGTSGSPDQRNIKRFGGSLTLSIGSAFTLVGEFSFTRQVVGTTTKLMIGAANVGTAPGGSVTADGGEAFNLSNGTLGLVLFNNNGVSMGYSMVASATAAAALGGATGNATLTIRRNSTTSAQTETVVVGTTSIPVAFTSSEIATGNPVTAFQAIVLSNASLQIDNTLIITAAQGTTTTPVTGASSVNLTGVTLTLQNGAAGPALFAISAGSAVYTTFSGAVTNAAATGASLPARVEGTGWAAGDKNLRMTNVTFSIGSYVSFTADVIDLQHFVVGANTTNSFNFSGATITFFADGQPMVALSGSPRFQFSTTGGFQLVSFTNPGFAFMGGAPPVGGLSSGLPQSAVSDPNAPPRAAADPPPTVVALGPISLTNPGFSFTNFQFKFSDSGPPGTVNLSAVLHFTAANASIGASTAPTRATITGLDASFTLTAAFDLLNLSTPPTVSANGFNVKANRFDISIGSFLTISATGTTQNPLQINPTAGATQDLISFATLSATLAVGPVNITGSASNFAIQGNGNFIAKDGFSVSLSLGQNGADSMSWPTWLPLQSATVGLAWPSFNTDPTGFVIQLSATVSISQFNGIPLTMTGSVTNVVIDPSLISQGKFPIVSIGSIAVSVSGNLFGGSVSGTLIAGVLRFDSTGATVDGLGNRTGTTTPGVGPFTSAFYAGIQAGFSFGGMSGFNIRIGLSDFGPLQVYVEAGVPIPLGPTGLFISNFRGGITFGAQFPTVTLSNPIAARDALQLRKPGFSTPNALTAAQWEAQLRTQVANMFHSGATAGSGWSNLAAGPFIIQAGATLYAANENAFRVDADILFDTTGKFLVIGSATIGSTLSVGVKMFADLSQPAASVKLLYLMEVPSQNVANPVTPPIYSVYGVATFSFTNNVFQINIAGAAEFNLLGGLVARIEASLSLTFSSSSFNITLSNASLFIPTIQVDSLGTAAGSVTIETVNDTTHVWGGFLLVPNLHGLEAMGIYAGGQVYIKLNTTSVAKTITLQGVPLTLDPGSFSLFINGHADFKVSNQQAFRISGTLTLQINPSSLTIFVQAQLLLGSNPLQPLFTFNANGLIHVQMQATAQVSTGFAAKVTLTMGATMPAGISFNTNWLLVINTTGSDVVFTIPAPVVTNPPSPPVATVMGPDFASSNPLALTSYEVVTGGVRTLVIPRGAPPSGTTNFKTWTSTTGAPYLIILGRGSVTIANSFTLTGTLNIVATTGSSGFNFSLSANASLALKANGNTVFTFNVNGGIQLSNAGVAAALTVSLSGGLPSNIGFTINNATFQLQLNTTGAPVTIGSTTVSAGTGGLYANVRITGDLRMLGGVVTLTGSFDLTVTGSSLRLGVNASITFFNATLTASGFAAIYYDSNPGLALRITLALPGGAQGVAPVAALGSQFVIKGSFTLEINTTGISRPDHNGVAIANGFKVAVSNLGVYLFGFDLTGSITISITSAGFGIDNLNLTLNLFGFASINLTGFYRPDGTFRFTGTAGFQFGNHTFGIGGSISVTISNSGFSASVSGWVAAFGVEISGSGAITISGGSVDIYVSIHVVITPEIRINTPAVTATLPWWLGGGTHTIIPAVNIVIPAVVVSGTAHFHLGSTSPAPTVAQVAPPPPPPTPPALAGVNSGGQLVLYLGQDVNNRKNSQGTVTPAQPSENYTLTHVSTQGGTQTIQVTALGFTQTFSGVSSILVSNTETGNDTITVGSGITVPVNMTLGSGSNTINTGGGAATINVTGNGTNTVTTANNASITLAGHGNNHVTTGSGSTVTISGNGGNRVVTNGGNAPIFISGSGNNTITVSNGGTATYTVTGTGANILGITGGVPTVNLQSTASGNNRVSINTSGASNVTVAGNGSNQVTVNGASAATVLVTGNGANQLTTGGGVSTITLRGTGNNQVSTGTGATTINDQGIGGTSVVAGPGGGVFIGGVNSSGVAFSSKGTSTVSSAHGNFTVRISGYASYSLNNASLNYGGFALGLNGITNVTLTAGSAVATNTFTLSGWTGSATLNGAGSNNTVFSAPGSGVGGLNYVLSNTQLQVTGGVTQTITLSGIQTANLVGASTGANTFNVSAWTGGGMLAGPTGSTNTVVATNDIATFTLTDQSLARTGRGTLALTGIQNVTLTGGAGANSFLVSDWSASATLNGAAGSDTYTLTLTGNGGGAITINDSGPTSGDTANVTGPRNVFVTSVQVRLGTQRVNYSGIAILNVDGSATGLSYNIQSTRAGVTTNVQTNGAASIINVRSTAGNIPVAAGNLNGIQGLLAVAGGGQMFIDDTGSFTARSGTLAATSLTGFGMGVSGIQYQGLSALDIRLGSGNNTLAITGVTATTTTTINGGSSNNDTVNGNFPGDFNGRIDLTAFEHGTFHVTGNFNGTLNATGPGHFESISTGANGSLSSSGRINVVSLDLLDIGLDLAGIVTVSGRLTTLDVGRDLSGSVTQSGVMTLVTVGRDITNTGSLNVSNASPANASITTMTVGRDLAGQLTVSGNVNALTVTGNLTGTVNVAGTLVTLRVIGNVSGSVTQTGTMTLVEIGGSVLAGGSITASNTADPAQTPAVAQPTLGNITTMTVGQNLAGMVLVSGTLSSLTIGTPSANGLLSATGTVTVRGTLTHLTVNGDVGGTVTQSGSANLWTITGSLLSGGQLRLVNPADPSAMLANIAHLTINLDLAGTVLVSGQLTRLTVGRDVSGSVTQAGTINQLSIGRDLTSTGAINATNPVPATANLTTLTVGGNLAGTVNVSGNLTTATITGNVSGTITVQNTLTTFNVTGNVSGTVTEHGTVTSINIGGSLTSTGVINATNTTANLGNITTFTIGVDLAGTVLVSGTLTTLTVGNDVSGTVTESGTITSITIGGSVTASGKINAVNSADPAQATAAPQTTLGNITTMSVARDLAGTVSVSGNLGALNVGTPTILGNLSGTVAVQNTLHTLKVTGNVSGNVTESGTITLITIGGSLTGTGKITAANSVPTTANITKLELTQDLAGTVLVSGALTTLMVGNDVSGSVTESGIIHQLTIGGSLTSTGVINAFNAADPLQAPAVAAPTLGNIATMTVGRDLAGKVSVSGTLDSLTVGTPSFAGNLSGEVVVQGTLNTLNVKGNVSGRVTQSGTINSLTIGGSLTASGVIHAVNLVPTVGNILTLSVGVDLAGTVLVSGTLTNLTVGHDLSGSVTQAGTITLARIGNDITSTGRLIASNPVATSANITKLEVGRNLAGTVTVSGTLTTLTVGNDVSGVVTESGTITLITIGGSLTATGRINAINTVPTLGNITTLAITLDLAGTVVVSGTLATLTVGRDLSGSVTESGTMTLVTIGGSITSTGVINAINSADPAQVGGAALAAFTTTSSTTLGNIVTMTVGQDLAGRVNVSGTFTSLTVGRNLSGTVAVQGQLTRLQVGGDVSGSVSESGTIESININGSLTATGVIRAVNTTQTLGNIVSLTIGQDFAGTIIVSGNLGTLAILRGSMTPTARLTVGSLDTLTIGPDQLSVGQNMAGIITVTGTLQTLRVAGGTPGQIIAGKIGTVSVYGGFGPVVLNVTENGIVRRIELASPAQPYPQPDLSSTATGPGRPTYVNLQFIYESGALSNPQLTARLTNGIGTARSQFDLSLVVHHSTAKFNLARLDAVGTSGVRNVVVEGDLLTSVTTTAAAFFRSSPASMPGGVRLPADDVVGVSIRDFAPNGFIQARTIQAVAFGSHVANNGSLGAGAGASANEAGRLLTSDTRIVQTVDTVRVAFAEGSNRHVGLFVATRTQGGNFDSQNVALTIQSLVAANATGTGNTTTPNNLARGAATALVTVGLSSGRDSVIETVAIRGDGASLSTQQYISRAITSTGPLGDLTLRSSQGVADITAPSIFGSIVANGDITGTIQTTGLRTDPVNGAVSNLTPNIGRLYVAATNKGPAVVATVIEAKGLSGRIISRGDLVSFVDLNNGLDGVIAVQGNLGATLGSARFGGIEAGGGVSSSIVILGQQIADVRFNGGFRGGSYAVSGNILGNILINGMQDGSKLIAGGSIGDAANGTTLTVNGNNRGIIAAMGSIRFGKGSPGGVVLTNLGATPASPNALAVRAVFTNGGAMLRLDVTGSDLQGLALILTDLVNLTASSNGTLSGPQP